MLKNKILENYEKLSGYSLDENDPIVAISFIFQKIIEEQEEYLTKRFYLTFAIVGILSFLVGMSIGILF